MLPQENRLKKTRDFDLIWKKGQFFGTKFITFKYMKNSLPHTRVGFVVGTKVSKLATRRNKLKRQMREIIRLNLDKIKPGYDISITARPGATQMEYEEVEKNLLFALKKAGLM
ncbi:MAG: ribonuclease P protein component [Patescibacteria group bacterium]